MKARALCAARLRPRVFGRATPTPGYDVMRMPTSGGNGARPTALAFTASPDPQGWIAPESTSLPSSPLALREGSEELRVKSRRESVLENVSHVDQPVSGLKTHRIGRVSSASRFPRITR
jgi:hypothetical protein